MRHFPSAEEDRRLDLVAVGQEALDVVLLELEIVLVHLRPELDFLDLDDLLVLSGFAGALLLLVLVLAEIHDAADRRLRHRRDLDQVQTLLASNGQRLLRRHDAQLLGGVIDDTNFPHPDPFIDPRAVVTSWSGAIESEMDLSLIHISEPTRLGMISYAVFCLKK